LNPFRPSSSNYFQLHPFSKEKTDALAIVRPTNTFRQYRTNINSDELSAQALVFVLWDAVCDLKIITYELGMSKTYRNEGYIPPIL
jgi:hypothetical protein